MPRLTLAASLSHPARMIQGMQMDHPAGHRPGQPWRRHEIRTTSGLLTFETRLLGLGEWEHRRARVGDRIVNRSELEEILRLARELAGAS